MPKERFQRTLARALLKTPQPLLRVLNGAADSKRGNTLHPNLQLLSRATQNAPGIEQLPLAQARKSMDSFSTVYDAKPPSMARVEDMSIVSDEKHTLVLRRYQAKKWHTGGITLLYFHGGGHVVGSIDSHDASCRRLAHALKAQIFSVNYRLAPEHKFPAAVNDATFSYRYLLQQTKKFHINAQRFVIAGDSAGGNLAAVCCLYAKENNLPQPACQLLIYPMTDLRMQHRSYQEFGQGYLLTHNMMDWFVNHYAQAHERTNPYASPLLAESLKGLAPTVITLAGFDPLQDEGAAYAEKLSQNGVPVEIIMHGDLVHGHIAMAGTLPAAKNAIDDMAKAVLKQLKLAL